VIRPARPRDGASPARFAGAGLLAALLLAGAAWGQQVHPAVAQQAAIGPPPGPWPMTRGDGARTGRIHALPTALDPLWKAQLPGGLDFPVIATDHGTWIAATAGGLLLEIDAAGQEISRRPLAAPPAQAPLLTSGGDVAVITLGSECVVHDASGALRYRAPLPARSRDLRAMPLPSAGGGLVIAAGATLLHLGPDGRTLARGQLPEVAVGALVAQGDAVLATLENGSVYRWKAPDAPRLLGSFGGVLTSPAALSGRFLVAAVDSRRLVFLDVGTGSVAAAVPGAVVFEGPVAVGGGGEVWVTTGAGALVALGTDGKEIERRALARGAQGDLTALPLLVAPGGQGAFVRASGEVGLWAKGSVRLADQRACGEPVGLSGDGDHLVVACRDGAVVAFGKSSSASKNTP
jgi:outer membrane protein assembly factor BamB